MPKVLITGGTGFIGKALAEHLASSGFMVRTFDMFPAKNIIGEHIAGTIMYPDDIYKAAIGCEYVVHLAAMLGVKRTERDRMECLNVNIQGTKNVLDSCVRAGVKKIVFSSSSEVYGEPTATPISEEDRVSPKSVYAITKLAGEEYCRAYKQLHGLEYSIARFFNIYGPGQVAEFVLPKFIRAVMAGIPLTINGSGTQVRSFCYVQDAVRGVELLLRNAAADSQIFNIGNDCAMVTILELAQKIMAHMGKNSGIRFIKSGEADRSDARDIMKRIPDITKARSLLGYQPTVSLDEGIARLLESGDIPESWARAS